MCDLLRRLWLVLIQAMDWDICLCLESWVCLVQNLSGSKLTALLLELELEPLAAWAQRR